MPHMLTENDVHLQAAACSLKLKVDRLIINSDLGDWNLQNLVNSRDRNIAQKTKMIWQRSLFLTIIMSNGGLI